MPVGAVIEVGEKFGNLSCLPVQWDRGLVPVETVHHDLEKTIEIVEELMKTHKSAIEDSRQSSDHDVTKDPAICLVLDDCVLDSETWRSKTFKELFCNHQSYRMTPIVGMSFTGYLPIGIRNNIDFVFCFRENNDTLKQRLYDHYAGIFPTYESFLETFDKYTKDHGCLVLYLTSPSSRIEDTVFWYRAELTNHT